MYKECVKVEEVSTDRVRIKFEKNKMCSCCRMGGVCAKGEDTLTIDGCGFSLKSGDKIEVGVEEKKTFLAGIAMFLLPAVIFISNLIVFEHKTELVGFSLALGSVCIYYIALKIVLKKHGKKFNLRILRKL